MKKKLMLLILMVVLIIPVQSMMAQNKKEDKGIPMRDVEPYSIIYPVYLSVNVINAEIGGAYPNVYVYTECYAYAWGEITGIQTMATGVTDELGYIGDYSGDPLTGLAMTYRMRVVVGLLTGYPAREVDVPFQTGLTDVHIYLNRDGSGYVVVRYNDGSALQATLGYA